MTEAVIVATARTPIGRAFKGSLKDLRPDDLSEQVVRGLLEKLPALDPRPSTTSTGAAPTPAAPTVPTWRASSRCSPAWTTCRPPP